MELIRDVQLSLYQKYDLKTRPGDVYHTISFDWEREASAWCLVVYVDDKQVAFIPQGFDGQLSLSRTFMFRGSVDDVYKLNFPGIYSSDRAANAPKTGYVTYVCILQNNDSKYPIIFGLAMDGGIWNCWKTTSGSFSNWRRIDI